MTTDEEYLDDLMEYARANGLLKSDNDLRGEIIYLINARIQNLRLLEKWVKSGKRPESLASFNSMTQFAQWLSSGEAKESLKTIIRDVSEFELQTEGR